MSTPAERRALLDAFRSEVDAPELTPDELAQGFVEAPDYSKLPPPDLDAHPAPAPLSQADMDAAFEEALGPVPTAEELAAWRRRIGAP